MPVLGSGITGEELARMRMTLDPWTGRCPLIKVSSYTICNVFLSRAKILLTLLTLAELKKQKREYFDFHMGNIFREHTRPDPQMLCKDKLVISAFSHPY